MHPNSSNNSFNSIYRLFHYLDATHPHIVKGSCVDDRNIRGSREQILKAYALME